MDRESLAVFVHRAAVPARGAKVPASWEGKGAHVFIHANTVCLRPRLVKWGRCHGTQERASVVCLSTLEVLPRFGSTFWVSPDELRRTDNKIQRLCTGGQSVQDGRPVSVRVLFNLRNGPWLASLDVR